MVRGPWVAFFCNASKQWSVQRFGACDDFGPMLGVAFPAMLEEYSLANSGVGLRLPGVQTEAQPSMCTMLPAV